MMGYNNEENNTSGNLEDQKNKKNEDSKESPANISIKEQGKISATCQLGNFIDMKIRKRHRKKNKAKIAFDDETFTKDKAEATIIKIRSDDNQYNGNKSKVVKNKNHKVKTQMGMLSIDVNSSEISEESVSKKKKKRNKISQAETESKSEAENSFGEDPDVLLNNVNSEEGIPKKKKKRNKLLQDETITESKAETEQHSSEESEIKKKPSIRAQKRAKHLKIIEETKLKNELNMQQRCLNYLSQWKHDKSSWKFEKLKQVWLLQNLYDEARIPNEFWDTTVKYFNNAKGRVKEVLLKEALKLVESSDEQEQDSVDVKYKRARNLVQNLQE